ncbi:sulfatase family protein [Rubripirellula amarantea]|nr:arylsulfatase [Rubripirellula amarantea]
MPESDYQNSTTVNLIIAVIAVILGFDCQHAVAEEVPTSGTRPNILILYADDLGFGDLSCYNDHGKIPTPNLDRLASQGIRFTDGHSSSGICSPSRFALLTGRHHWRDFHGIVQSFGRSLFEHERLTMPEMLQAKGYHTAAIGKWHLGWDWNAIRKPNSEGVVNDKGVQPDDFDWTLPIPDGPLAHGFDHYFGDTVINFPPYCWIKDDRVVRAPDAMLDTTKWRANKEGSWECRPGPMLSDWDPYQNIPTTTDHAIDFINSQAKQERPFFLYFAFPSPHAPIVPNDEFDGKSKAGPYGDFVVETDDACGRLLRALESSGQAENTIVVFTSDNGPERYAYARDEAFDHWSSQPFRGLKRDIYEGGHHVPFIVKWPGVTRSGRVCDALVSQIDLMATFADALDFELPHDAAEDSHSLIPLLKDEQASVRQTHVHNTRKNQYAIRHGDWLLVDAKNGYLSGRNQQWEQRHGYGEDDEGTVELYDLKSDIGQRFNLADQHPEKVTELQRLLTQIREQGHSAPRLSTIP